MKPNVATSQRPVSAIQNRPATVGHSIRADLRLADYVRGRALELVTAIAGQPTPTLAHELAGAIGLDMYAVAVEARAILAARRASRFAVSGFGRSPGERPGCAPTTTDAIGATVGPTLADQPEPTCSGTGPAGTRTASACPPRDDRTATAADDRPAVDAPLGEASALHGDATAIGADRLADLAALLGPDELEVLIAVAEGIARGRRVYGQLEIDRDRRDFAAEAGAELRDALVYVAAELVRLQRRQRTATGAPR